LGQKRTERGKRGNIVSFLWGEKRKGLIIVKKRKWLRKGKVFTQKVGEKSFQDRLAARVRGRREKKKVTPIGDRRRICFKGGGGDTWDPEKKNGLSLFEGEGFSAEKVRKTPLVLQNKLP